MISRRKTQPSAWVILFLKVQRDVRKESFLTSKEEFCIFIKLNVNACSLLGGPSQMQNLKFISNNQIRHAAVIGDGKLQFVRNFEALEEWNKENISNGQKFTLF